LGFTASSGGLRRARIAATACSEAASEDEDSLYTMQEATQARHNGPKSQRSVAAADGWDSLYTMQTAVGIPEGHRRLMMKVSFQNARTRSTDRSTVRPVQLE
jgi:hypothetical protein